MLQKCRDRLYGHYGYINVYFCKKYYPNVDAFRCTAYTFIGNDLVAAVEGWSDQSYCGTEDIYTRSNWSTHFAACFMTANPTF